MTPVATNAKVRPSMLRYLLHVDGAGSYLVFQGNAVEVGPVSESRPVDLALVAAESPAMTVSRSDDDYFLNAAATVPVNERPTRSKMLVPGDRIGVGPRGRIEFRRPNAASGTAVLRLNGARLLWGAVREVLLMDREIVLGASSAAHVRVRDVAGPVTLQAVSAAGAGEFVCRAEETIVVDGRPSGREARVPVGARVSVGGVSFVLCRE